MALVTCERGDEMAEEKNFENKVKQFLESKGCYFFKYWGGGQFTKAGIPDIICCHNGYFVGIEIKAKNGKPSPLQIHNLKKIDESGGYGVLLYPEDFELFKIFMMGLGIDYDERYEQLKGRWMNID